MTSSRGGIPRYYHGRALRSPWFLRSASHAGAALVVAAALAAGIFLSTLLPYLSNLPR